MENKLKNKAQEHLMNNTYDNLINSSMNDTNSRNEGFNKPNGYCKKPVSTLYQKDKHKKTFKKSTIHYADSETTRMYNFERNGASPGTMNHQYQHSMADV